MPWDVVILGAGAAGLMCAIEAGKRGRRVLLLEHADRVGKKILISGGGRCNFTNLRVGPECRSAKVELRLNSRVFSIENNGYFKLDTAQGMVEAEALVVATGGLSYAQLGASPFGYELAGRFGHGLRACHPALVPLTLPEALQERWRELSGVSMEVAVSCRNKTFREALLLTHRGLSGPAILQISSYWEAGEPIRIDLCPTLELRDYLLAKKRGGEKAELKNLLSALLPRRFIERWCELHFPSRPLPQCSDRELGELAHLLKNWELRPEGTEGYAKAEVTRGGVDTAELSSKNLESNQVPGLYFVGEVVDVTGQLGGYNFHWAWASGFAAGQTA